MPLSFTSTVFKEFQGRCSCTLYMLMLAARILPSPTPCGLHCVACSLLLRTALQCWGAHVLVIDAGSHCTRDAPSSSCLTNAARILPSPHPAARLCKERSWCMHAQPRPHPPRPICPAYPEGVITGDAHETPANRPSKRPQNQPRTDVAGPQTHSTLLSPVRQGANGQPTAATDAAPGLTEQDRDILICLLMV